MKPEDLPVESQSIEPMSAVTFEEAMAKIIGYEGTAVPEELIRTVDTQPWTDKTTRALADLNHKLEFCSLEDALLIRIECLKDLLSNQTDQDVAEDENGDGSDEVIKDAIREIDDKIEYLHFVKFQFETDRKRDPDTIETAVSPSGIRRYRAHSVAAWAREKRNIEIKDWYDISKVDLFARDIPEAISRWVNIAQEQLDAHFDVLNGLLFSLKQIDPRDLEGSNRYPREWHGIFKKNGTIKIQAIIDFVQHQIDRLEPPQNAELPEKDAFYERLNPWKKYYLTGLNSARPKYNNESIAYTQIIIAGLLIGLANDSYGEDLFETSGDAWPMPETIDKFASTSIQRISPETTNEILCRSIDRLMRQVREFDEA